MEPATQSWNLSTYLASCPTGELVRGYAIVWGRVACIWK